MISKYVKFVKKFTYRIRPKRLKVKPVQGSYPETRDS